MLKLTTEEFGVILTALATLHGMQLPDAKNSAEGETLEYLNAIDSASEKLCAIAGLPSDHFTKLKAMAERELIKRNNKKCPP